MYIYVPACKSIKLKANYIAGERDIQSLKVKCQKHKKGCQWVGELRNAKEHPKTCGYVIVQCNYKCEGGQEELYRKHLEKHQAVECPRRPHNCPHCNESGEYKDIASPKHIDACPKFIINCPNAPSCKKSFPRENKNKHLSTCEFQMTRCKYSELGCNALLARRDLPDHEKEDKVHLGDAMKTILSLKQQCSLLTSQLHNLSTMSQNNFTSIFKMSNFEQKKEENIEYFSNPFYTHPKGYKMAFNVDANGYGKYKGTHVSVWIYLMRGEYDDQLEFPFKGTITFELLNQLEDNIHHSKSYTHDGKQETSNRVIDSDRSQNAAGVHAFIPHENLGHNIIENCKCQYLKDDCLVFRVSVSMPSYKPWLQCT